MYRTCNTILYIYICIEYTFHTDIMYSMHRKMYCSKKICTKEACIHSKYCPTLL